MFHSRSGLPRLDRGQTIIEAAIALALIIVVLGAIAIAVLTGFGNSQFVSDQTQSSKYAQDGMEYIRYLSNNDPATFDGISATSTIYCYNIPTGSIDDTFDPIACPNTPNISGKFVRSAQFERNEASLCGGGTKVTVWVAWRSGKCEATDYCHTSQLVSCFPKKPPAPTL